MPLRKSKGSPWSSVCICISHWCDLVVCFSPQVSNGTEDNTDDDAFGGCDVSSGCLRYVVGYDIIYVWGGCECFELQADVLV